MNYTSKFRQLTGGHQEVPSSWASPSNLRSLILADPVLLWLALGFGDTHGFRRDPEEYLFLHWIGQKGHDFEAACIKNLFPEAFQCMVHDYDVRQADEFKKTLLAMDAGIPVLHKAGLWSAGLQLFGTADLLIRSDHFYSLFPHLMPNEPEPVHFLVADCKFSANMDQPSKKKDLLINSTQVRIYSALLGLIQGYMPRRAYLVTRTYPDLPTPIEVNLSLEEPLDADMRDLRAQFQHIRKNGADLLPWRDSVIAPCISNDKTEPWSQAKKQIIARMPNRPLELLPSIGQVKADAMRASGILHLDHLLATPPEKVNLRKIRGIGAKTDATLQAVLQAHRTGKPSHIPAHAITPPCDMELFLDYETLSNCNVSFEDDFETLSGVPMIFMVGIGHIENGRWYYQQIVAPAESPEGECILLDRLHAVLDRYSVFDTRRSVKVWHWSAAERSCSAAAVARQGSAYNWLPRLPWHDLQKVVKDANIAMPGCLGFGLKEYTAALGKYDAHYAVEWPSGLDVGLSAMVCGWEMYQQPRPMQSKEFNLLSAYLEADVKGLWRVLSWIRANTQTERTALVLPPLTGWYTTALHMLVASNGRDAPMSYSTIYPDGCK